MILFKTTKPLKEHLEKLRGTNASIGFVPTMGALHSGHLSLIEASKKSCTETVCSIFVNPTQFNDKKDFEKYPVNIEKDIFLLETHKTDILFRPSTSEIYREGTDLLMQYDLGYLETILEGKYRPGHFQGVCNVMYRLLNIVHPGTLFLGRKDYQQYLVLKKLIQEFFPDIAISLVEIKREESGLAMSSRNMRLSDKAKKNAAVIYRALQLIKQNITQNNLQDVKAKAAELIMQNGFDKIDYIEICDADTLLPSNGKKVPAKLIVLAAAYIEGVRLIDNLEI